MLNFVFILSKVSSLIFSSVVFFINSNESENVKSPKGLTSFTRSFFRLLIILLVIVL